MDKHTEDVVRKLKAQIDINKADIEEFAKELQKDPFHTLEWSDNLFMAAATVQIYSRLLNALTAKDTKATVETLRVYAQREALQGARNPRRSTSTVSNPRSPCSDFSMGRGSRSSLWYS